MKCVMAIEQDSYQEYTGENSTVFFLKDCNLRCRYCHNKESWNFPEYKCLSIQSAIEKGDSPLCSAFVFSGGEPTLHPKEVKKGIKMALKRGKKAKIFTNGILSPVVLDLVAMGLSAISIDIKFATSKNIVGLPVFWSAEEYKSHIAGLINSLPENFDTELRLTFWEGITSLEKERMLNFAHKFKGCKVISQIERKQK